MSHKTFRVLIADDTQANRALLRAYLGRLGFETLMVADGELAVEMFRAEHPDIVLMDLMMPKMDGFEAIRRIRMHAGEQWVPIVIVSAMDAEYDVVRGLEAGADDYLTKPLSYQVFSAKMRNLARALEFQSSREDARRREAAVSDAMVDGVVTFDTELRVVDANRAAAEIFGAQDSGLKGQDLRDLIWDADGAAQWVQPFRNYLEDASSPFFGKLRELVGRRLDGWSFPIEACMTELPAPDERLFIVVVRDISERKRVARQLAENSSRLQQYHDEAEAEAELAKDIMERHIRRDVLEQSGVHHFVMPTQRFSGDIVLAARSRSGKLYAMLADATGHGLAAAMSGLAFVHDFYRAVEDELPLHRMVLMLNNTLTDLLPTGRFVSAGLVVIDQKKGNGALWLGGVPEVMLIDANGRVVRRFEADHLPLGVESCGVGDIHIHSVEWQSEAQLLLCSDGVIEAEGPNGRTFGYDGVEAAIAATPCHARLEALCSALQSFLDGRSGHDDVSFLLLDLPPVARHE